MFLCRSYTSDLLSVYLWLLWHCPVLESVIYRKLLVTYPGLQGSVNYRRESVHPVVSV